MCEVTKDQIEKGRQLYQEFLAGITGDFYSLLFSAIAKADVMNIKRMGKGFPGETFAYLEYTGQLQRVDFRIKDHLYCIDELPGNRCLYGFHHPECPKYK